MNVKSEIYLGAIVFYLKIKKIYFILILSLLLEGCSQYKKHALSGTAMGMQYNVTLYAHKKHKEIVFQNLIKETFDNLGQVLSHFIPNSEVSKINKLQAGVRLKVSEDLMKVLERSEEISKMTNGQFDITVGPLVELWGFGTEGFPNQLPSLKDIKKILKAVGYQKLVLHKEANEIEKKVSDLQINVSAIGKGYMIDALGESLEEKGVKSYLIEMGGEIRAKRSSLDKQYWRVGIEVPTQSTQRKIFELIPLYNGAVATSGSYRNYYVKQGNVYSHTIDTKTGYPVKEGPVSVTVIDNECWKADALATALMSMPLERAKIWAEKHSVAALIVQIKPNGKLTSYKTKAFKARVPEEISFL